MNGNTSFAQLHLLSENPSEAAIYYEWLLELIPGAQPGDALSWVGIHCVASSILGPDLAKGWVPVFAANASDAAIQRIQGISRTVSQAQAQSQAQGQVQGQGRERRVSYVMDSSGIWTGVIVPSPNGPGGRSADNVEVSDIANCDYSALDIDAATAFLEALLNAGHLSVRDDPFDMRFIYSHRNIVAGVLQLHGVEGFSARAYWLTYFEVRDIAVSIARAVETGSRVLIPATASPFNIYAVLEDPWGNTFGFSTLNAQAASLPIPVYDYRGESTTLDQLVDI